jgi:1-aminocyclopropane-1-carboxylate deaminase
MMHHLKKSFIQTLPHPAFHQRQLSVSVLRADQIHPVISGNKWMKLQPWIKKARATGAYAILSKGGPWSNHLHAAAYTCQQEHLEFTAIVKASPGFMTATLQDVLQWNGKIIYADHGQYSDELYWENMAFVQDALYIPMGGEGPEAVMGVSDYFNELPPRFYDYILCPIGTGTTYMGIAASNMHFRSLLAFDPGINDKNYTALLQALQEDYPSKTFSFTTDPALKKFGQWPDFLPSKMNQWFEQWQLPTDIIYTAKMFHYFEQLVTDDFFEPGASILLIHTGGLQGNRSLPAGLLTF